MRMRLVIAMVGAALLMLASCSGRMPTVDETNAVVSRLRDYDAWAWALGIGLIWADLILPVPQTAIIAALGIVYGTVVGGLVGSFALITSGLLAYFLMRTHARRFVVRLAGQRLLDKMGVFFDRSGTWAIVLTRSLPYSIPEAMTFLAGLSRMPFEKFLTSHGSWQCSHCLRLRRGRRGVGRSAAPGPRYQLRASGCLVAGRAPNDAQEW